MRVISVKKPPTSPIVFTRGESNKVKKPAAKESVEPWHIYSGAVVGGILGYAWLKIAKEKKVKLWWQIIKEFGGREWK